MPANLRLGRIVAVTIDFQGTVRPGVVTSFRHDDDVTARVACESALEQTRAVHALAERGIGAERDGLGLLIRNMQLGDKPGQWLVPNGERW